MLNNTNTKSKLEVVLQKGFTLIELMIVVAIVAIIASIAYPSYTESIRKSRRADAQAVLLESGQFLERFFTENNRYDQSVAGVATALPAYLAQAPKEGATKYYNVNLQTVTNLGYTLSAVPINAQLTDRCGTMTYSITGAKGAAQTDCWRR
jgi:type IV pilus assembly protein PilE